MTFVRYLKFLAIQVFVNVITLNIMVLYHGDINEGMKIASCILSIAIALFWAIETKTYERKSRKTIKKTGGRP